MNKSVVELVNEIIISKLEKGVNPWRKPWISWHGIELNTPKNYITNKEYQGINCVLLDTGYYATFKQIKDLGGTVKKGAKGNMVVYSAPYKTNTTNEETGEIMEKMGFVLKYYYVFNMDDTEGCREIKNRQLAENPTASASKTNEEIDNIIFDYCKRAKLDFQPMAQDKAYYRPSTHAVRIPLISQFKELSEYYSTAFHELGHSTGASFLLNREGVAGTVSHFGNNVYSKEELIAEITAAYCLNYCNIATNATNDNSVAYLQNWASHLKGNTANWFIINATTKATEAFNLIMNI